MLNRNGRAILTASLVADRREHVIDRLFSVPPSDAEPHAPASSLFPAKRTVSPMPKRRPASLAPGHEPRTRMTLRLTQEQLWRLRLAAAYVRQSCQVFLVDALDRHIARLARDPSHGTLGALLGGAPAPHG